ncbi:glycosyltransferase, partial [bacterium]|nr:glycosyltransferase [bacterium]
SFWDGITGKRILAVGSFKDQKDHESLIRAFAKLQNSLSATLVIVGEGPLRPKLEDLIAELSLEKSVKLPGFFANPYLWYRDADLFVLSSLYEGFGNVIVEALECGVPVVSTDCLSGPREILEDGKYGRLVPVGDVDALAAGMYNSLHESVDHALLEKRAKDFSVDIISSQYLNVMFPSR